MLEVFAYGELGRCNGEGNLPSPWKDALTLSPALPQAAVQQNLPAVSLAMFGQAFLSTAHSHCPADCPGGWQTQGHAGEKGHLGGRAHHLQRWEAWRGLLLSEGKDFFLLNLNFSPICI